MSLNNLIAGDAGVRGTFEKFGQASWNETPLCLSREP
jgi:hypothetical protein